VSEPIKRALRRFPRLYAGVQYLKLRLRRRSFTTHNLIRREARAIATDLDYALDYARTLIGLMEQHGIPVAGARVLELGPGPNLAPQLILASLGAEVIVADPYLPAWDPEYHPALYRGLTERWSGPTAALAAAVAKGSHDGLVTAVAEPAEKLASIESGSIDFLFSNAVLEHIVDIGEVSAETARVTRTGGIASHSIDLRDHRDFERPLEHLMHGERFFRALVRVIGFEIGNRLRSIEFWAHFENSGWDVLERRTTSADLDYLDEATARLRRSRSIYRRWPTEDLARTGVYFVLRRAGPDRPARTREAAADRLALIEALKQASRNRRGAAQACVGPLRARITRICAKR
jgi:SAM-dependent methyltransferase